MFFVESSSLLWLKTVDYKCPISYRNNVASRRQCFLKIYMLYSRQIVVLSGRQIQIMNRNLQCSFCQIKFQRILKDNDYFCDSLPRRATRLLLDQNLYQTFKNEIGTQIREKTTNCYKAARKYSAHTSSNITGNGQDS